MNGRVNGIFVLSALTELFQNYYMLAQRTSKTRNKEQEPKSPYHINTLSSRRILRMKKMIN